MKEVALFDAKNNLSALVSEVEATGVEVVITRHGKPAAKLTRAEPSRALSREAAAARLVALREEVAARLPPAALVPWETLKRWMRDEDEDDAP